MVNIKHEVVVRFLYLLCVLQWEEGEVVTVVAVVGSLYGGNASSSPTPAAVG